MTSGQPQGDNIIDPTYHRTPYFRQSTQSQLTEKVPTFYVYRYSDKWQGPLNNNACGCMILYFDPACPILGNIV